MNTPQLYHIHMRSLLTGETRTGQAQVTHGVGQPIVDRMNQEQRGRVTYELLPVGETAEPAPVIDRQIYIDLLLDLKAQPQR